MPFPYALGWKPALPGHNLHPRVTFDSSITAALPPAAPRLSQFLPPIWQQGRLGACTAHGLLRAFHYAAKKAGHDLAMRSRLALYFMERDKEGTTGSDAGAVIADGIQVLLEQGVCPETEWTYDDTPADPRTGIFPAGAKPALRPTDQCYADAKKSVILKTAEITCTLDQIKAALTLGFPVVLGSPVYEEEWMGQQASQTGVIAYPGPRSRLVGGHCFVLSGYWNDAKRQLGMDNSWGTGWGDHGSGYLDYNYALGNMFSDAHIIYDVSVDTVVPTPTPPGPDPVPPTPNPNPTPTPQQLQLDWSEKLARAILGVSGHVIHEPGRVGDRWGVV